MLDVVCEVTDDFLKKEEILKGNMQLISQERAEYLLSLIKPIKRTAGGSAANTISSLSKLGLKTAYIGKIANDVEGDLFQKDLDDQTITYKTKTLTKKSGLTTGKCIVMVTPDRDRTMNTYLGATEFLEKKDINIEIIEKSEWLYLEGYRFDGKESKDAFYKAIEIAEKSKTKIALSLSDSFCVDRHRSDFFKLIKSHTDLLFCNQEELKSLYQVSNLTQAFSRCKKDVSITACTADKDGVYIVDQHTQNLIPANTVDIVDSTGAGDNFASGFLFGLIKNKSITESGDLGNRMAEEVLKVYGPRVEINLKNFFNI
jgi:sugar/nucleoside kinase (ribokinase family)